MVIITQPRMSGNATQRGRSRRYGLTRAGLESAKRDRATRYLQNQPRIQVRLYEQVSMWKEGCLIDFDEGLDDAEDIHMKSNSRKPLGCVMLKGANII